MGCTGSRTATATKGGGADGGGNNSTVGGPTALVTSMYERDAQGFAKAFADAHDQQQQQPPPSSSSARRRARAGSRASSAASTTGGDSSANDLSEDGFDDGRPPLSGGAGSHQQRRQSRDRYQQQRPPPLAAAGGGPPTGSTSGSPRAPPKKPKVVTPTTPATAQHVVIMRNEILGRGGYGVVYRAYNKMTKTALAVKECQFDESSVKLVDSLRKEYDVLSKLDNSHVVRVYHFTVEANRVARIFMELMPMGSVRTLMGALGGRFSETSARRIVHQALLGLAYLHQRGIIHRDLKPDNMLIDGHGFVKLSDFGTAKTTIHTASGTTTMVCGTVVYMAPETINGRYSFGSDVWAIAATFIELVSGKLPWHELDIQQSVPLLFHIGNPRGPGHHPRIPPHVQDPQGRRLIKRCFAADPKKRPTVHELLSDPYFAFRDVAGTDADHHSPHARRRYSSSHNNAAPTSVNSNGSASSAHHQQLQSPQRHPAAAAGGSSSPHASPRPTSSSASKRRPPQHFYDDDDEDDEDGAAVGGDEDDDFEPLEEVATDSLGDSFASLSADEH